MKLKEYALATFFSLNLSCATQQNLERLQNQIQYTTRLEMEKYHKQLLVLEKNISESNISANIWTTIDARVLMEDKSRMVNEIANATSSAISYFNTIMASRIGNINIIIDEDPDYIAYSLSRTNIIVFNEDSLERLIENDYLHMKEVTIVHEFTHMQSTMYDPDEPLVYKEFAPIIIESLFYIKNYGYDFYKEHYMGLWSWYWFRPEHITSENNTDHTAIRLVIRQFITDAFERRITWDDNKQPMEKLEEFAKTYIIEQANGRAGFDNAASDFEFNGHELRLNDIRNEAYKNFVNE